MSEEPVKYEARTSEQVLACPACGEQAIQAADIEWVHPKSNEFRSLYYWHCFDGDCGFEGPKTYSDAGSLELWNQRARTYK